MELHERLLQLRKERGMTQKQLARQLHVARSTIAAYENGRDSHLTPCCVSWRIFFRRQPGLSFRSK